MYEEESIINHYETFASRSRQIAGPPKDPSIQTRSAASNSLPSQRSWSWCWRPKTKTPTAVAKATRDVQTMCSDRAVRWTRRWGIFLCVRGCKRPDAEFARAEREKERRTGSIWKYGKLRGHATCTGTNLFVPIWYVLHVSHVFPHSPSQGGPEIRRQTSGGALLRFHPRFGCAALISLVHTKPERVGALADLNCPLAEFRAAGESGRSSK